MAGFAKWGAGRPPAQRWEPTTELWEAVNAV